jgi:hypothetical protein
MKMQNVDLSLYCCGSLKVSRFRQPRGLGRSSSASWLLGSRVRIPLRAWMFVSSANMLCPA